MSQIGQLFTTYKFMKILSSIYEKSLVACTLVKFFWRVALEHCYVIILWNCKLRRLLLTPAMTSITLFISQVQNSNDYYSKDTWGKNSTIYVRLYCIYSIKIVFCNHNMFVYYTFSKWLVSEKWVIYKLSSWLLFSE